MSVIVVTGSTAGLGYHCVEHLARRMANKSSGKAATIPEDPPFQGIIMACRNVKSAKIAANNIAKTSGCLPSKIIVLEDNCNLCELENVRKYAASLIKFLQENKLRIKILINNAGIGGSLKLSRNSAGHEAIFATNHLGHFLLTILLLPYIDERIVNVSSETHDPAEKTPLPDPEKFWPCDDDEYEKHLLRAEIDRGEKPSVSGRRRYTQSKLSNIFFTNELAKLLTGSLPAYLDETVKAELQATLSLENKVLPPSGKHLKFIAYNPGLMLDTKFITTAFGAFRGLYSFLLIPFLRFTSVGHFIRDVNTSANRLARISLGEIEGDATATYFMDDRSKPSSVFSRTFKAVSQLQVELWNHSVRWANVSPEELQAAGLA